MNLLKLTEQYTVSSLILSPYYSTILNSVDKKLSQVGLVNMFLYYGDKEKDLNKNSVFLLFDWSLLEPFHVYFRIDELYIDTHYLTNDYVLVEMRLPVPGMKETIMSGRYSRLMNDDYHKEVNKNSVGFKIVTRDKELERAWRRIEEDLGCDILEHGEVFPRALKGKETYLSHIKEKVK